MSNRFDQINMVPFIDVVLVLLAIVMTTASFVSQGLIEVNLPASSTASEASQDTKSFEIAIKADNTIYYEGELISLEALNTQLATLAAHSKFLLRIDKSANFQKFINVFDALKQHAFDDIAVETEL